MSSWMSGTIARALLIIACAPAAAAAQQLSGITFDITSTSHAATDSTVTSGKGWVAGAQLRLDLNGATLIGPAAGMPGGNHTFLIRRDSLQQNVVTLVDHSDSTYMSPGKMMEQMTAMMASLPAEMRPRMSMETRNFRVDTLGAGEVISGFATRRYRTSMELVIKVEVMGHKEENAMTIESDAMYSDELAEFGILASWTRSYESMLGPLMGSDTSAAAQFRQLAAALPRGIPLKSEDRITSGGMPGARSVSVISNIVRTSFPRSVFDIPAGYTETVIPSAPALN